jgi:hypothetical protein
MGMLAGSLTERRARESFHLSLFSRIFFLPTAAVTALFGDRRITEFRHLCRSLCVRNSTMIPSRTTSYHVLKPASPSGLATFCR